MENHQNHKGEAEPDIEKNHQQHRNQAWGTWEELLLACAVNRHGFKDWDAVAMEVQSRTTRLLATARHCEQRFHDLSRRFTDDVPPPRQNGTAAGDNADHVPWLDELRKLRVAELRREVQRSDVSILSLQLEVKRLEEEKATENDGKADEKPDLAVSGEARPENDKTGGEVEEAGPANSEPEGTANVEKMLPTTGDESDRENQSVNESNSTGSRFEKTGEGEAKLGGPVPVQSGSKEPDPVARKGKPVGEESNNGSYDALAKVPTCESVPPSEEHKVEEDDDSSELHDSVAHSGEGATRESSEVQSSASLTRKRKTRRRKELSGGEAPPPENDEVAMVKSEPLVGVFELIKGHEQSSLFERRLESQQDSDRYKDIVKQPLDLETIQLRLQKGHYSSCTSAFFRDLLLLFTNASVFFPHDSAESQAGRQLHRLVTAEMKNRGQAQSDPVSRKNDPLPPNAPLAKPDSLFSKNKASSGPILVCRKRSSMSAKPSSATFGQKGGDQPVFNDKKERPSSDAKPPMKPSSDTDEEELPKAKEKPVTGARSLRRSNKNLNNNNNNNNTNNNNNNNNSNNKKLPSNSTPKAGSSGNKPPETLKQEKSKAEGGPDKKRSAAADFLKRIKRNTSVEASKGGSGSGGGGGSSGSSKGGGGGIGAKEQKKMVNNGKGDKGKERASRHNAGGGSGSAGDKRNNKNVVETNSQSKRSVGRPPKKAPAEANAGSAKRGRESSAGASAGKDKRPKKRSKK